jgi:hypothetical protein
MDEYYVLEADVSSSGGYINFMTVSVPIGANNTYTIIDHQPTSNMPRQDT